MGCHHSKMVDETASVSAGSVQTVLRPRYHRRKHQIRWAKEASACSGSRRVDPRVSAKYAVKAVIAKGRFSRVLRVENRLSKQPYAIKVIETRDGSHVETELAVLRRVRHPNVVRLEAWEHVSEEAKCVIRQLLQRNPVQRLSAAELLDHPWVAVTMAADAARRPAQVRFQRKVGEE
ncbi:serine/threonine-protein kinase H1 homolog [Rhipicephalus sanguineus]|uniref:serine/threonine-protein kinase H1 homolog n=1 Tax=Rhipicephalus sanguineus TaxID=34632 RepID=UPI0020C4020D|nr:serine/threonine-protein kinase H1 homolog [Rhipicephalus sanguineus]